MTTENPHDAIKTVEPEQPTVSGTADSEPGIQPRKKAASKSAATKKPAAKRRIKRGESATSPRRIKAIEETQQQALEYRKMAYSFSQIAEALGMKSAQAAHYAVNAALMRIIREPAEEVLKLELERLDGMFQKPYQAACGGDLMAVNSCLGIMARKAKLLGLDAPAKQEVSGPKGAPIATTVHDMTQADMDAAAKRLLDKY